MTPWYLSKTKWGAILAAFVVGMERLCEDPQLCFIPEGILAIIASISVVLIGVGARDAIAKNGQGR